MFIQSAFLQKTQQSRKASASASILEHGPLLSMDRTEEFEAQMVSEEVNLKTTKQGSSVRTTVSITSRQDVLTTGSMSAIGPSTSDTGGSVRNKERKTTKTTKVSVLDDKKEPKKKSSLMEFHNIKISQVITVQC